MTGFISLPILSYFCPSKFLMFVPTLSVQNFEGQKRNESVGRKKLNP